MKKLCLLFIALAFTLIVTAIFILAAQQQSQNLETAVLNIKAPGSKISEPPVLSRRRNFTNNVICFSIENQPQNIVKIAIRSQNMTEEILGIAFDFKFNPNAAQFLKYEKGDFFERGGNPFYLIKTAQDKNSVINGISLKRGDKLQKGTGVIIYLHFLKLNSSKQTFSFTNTVVSTLKYGLRKDLRDTIFTQCPIVQENARNSIF